MMKRVKKQKQAGIIILLSFILFSTRAFTQSCDTGCYRVTFIHPCTGSGIVFNYPVQNSIVSCGSLAGFNGAGFVPTPFYPSPQISASVNGVTLPQAGVTVVTYTMLPDSQCMNVLDYDIDSVPGQAPLYSIAFNAQVIGTGPAATANATPLNISPGDSTQLTATGGGTYQWQPAAGLSCDTCANTIATPTATTTYCVLVTDTNGCTDSACVTVNVGMSPQPCTSGCYRVTFTHPCTGSGIIFNYGFLTYNQQCGLEGSFNSVGFGSTPFYPSPQISCTINGVTVPQAGVTVVTYMMLPASQCMNVLDYDVDSVPGQAPLYTIAFNAQVIGAAPIILTAAQTNVNCNSDSNGTAWVAVDSGGVAPFTYSWNTIPVQTNDTATNLSAGIYTVTVTDANGCTSTQTVTITEPAAIAVTTSYTPTFCTASTGTATATPSGGTPGYTYLWSPSGQTTQTATGLGAGIYTVTVMDSNGCTKTQTVAVTSTNPVTLTTTSTQTGCTTNTGTATANPGNGTLPYTYSWNNGQTTQTATSLGTGTYTVTVTDANGCSQTQTASVTQAPNPSATASATPVTITSGNSTQLTATGGGTYQWQPATGLNCTTCANPSAAPTETTTYCVLVTDINGCTDSACVNINVEIPCGEVFVPNAFSPDNSSKNDLECVYGNCITLMRFSIYDRWGEKVFETTDPKQCWDGTYRGQLMNTAEFVFYLDATQSNGERITKKGNISLIR